MAQSIGVNLRVTGHCNQGGRKYMEDVFSVAYEQTEDKKDLKYAFFGIFDGHGGKEAALFAKENLMEFIVSQKNFWSDDDEHVLKAIRDGFLATHMAMWTKLENWPKTATGLPSTSGTTASIAIIRRGKIYVGHVGDSAIIMGYQGDVDESFWRAQRLTNDHKPECPHENNRIQQCGGKVVCKSGVPRVVWKRPKLGHKGPVRRSTHIDEIPFLAVARSLGDLWSYNSELDQFVVSPEPDVGVVRLDVGSHRCLILGTDGLWNMIQPEVAVNIVLTTERHNERHLFETVDSPKRWRNPSERLVDTALQRWRFVRLRADNTSVVTVMLDPPGPPKSHVVGNRAEKNEDTESRSSRLSDVSNDKPINTATDPKVASDDFCEKSDGRDLKENSSCDHGKKGVVKPVDEPMDTGSDGPSLKRVLRSNNNSSNPKTSGNLVPSQKSSSRPVVEACGCKSIHSDIENDKSCCKRTYSWLRHGDSDLSYLDVSKDKLRKALSNEKGDISVRDNFPTPVKSTSVRKPLIGSTKRNRTGRSYSGGPPSKYLRLHPPSRTMTHPARVNMVTRSRDRALK